ncbi:unnamed protein product [Chrysoparadoxa australica]
MRCLGTAALGLCALGRVFPCVGLPCFNVASSRDKKSLVNVTLLSGGSSGDSPYSARMQVMITRGMRKILVDELNYLNEEVDDMEPQIAATVIEKGLPRPRSGMPMAWRRSIRGYKPSIFTKLKNTFNQCRAGVCDAGGFVFSIPLKVLGIASKASKEGLRVTKALVPAAVIATVGYLAVIKAKDIISAAEEGGSVPSLLGLSAAGRSLRKVAERSNISDASGGRTGGSSKTSAKARAKASTEGTPLAPSSPAAAAGETAAAYESFASIEGIDDGEGIMEEIPEDYDSIPEAVSRRDAAKAQNQPSSGRSSKGVWQRPKKQKAPKEPVSEYTGNIRIIHGMAPSHLAGRPFGCSPLPFLCNDIRWIAGWTNKYQSY